MANIRRFEFTLLFGLLAGSAVTYPIWFPRGDFPLVPVTNLLGSIPFQVDWTISATVLLLTLIRLASLLFPFPIEKFPLEGTKNKFPLEGTNHKFLWGGVAGLLGLLFLLDQQRLQPWAWQYFWLALLLASGLSNEEKLNWARRITIGIYLYSGWAKFDLTFVETIGNEIAMVPSAWFDLDHLLISPWFFPSFEIGCGLLLLFPKSRRLGLIGSLLMHGVLILLLGPLGLGHQWGVFAWNGFFLFQNYCLFIERIPTGSNWSVSIGFRTIFKSPMRLALLGMLLVPLLEPVCWCDHWLAWGLYAPRASKIQLQVSADELQKLSELELKKFGIPAERLTEELLVELDLNQWALETTGTPVYPQSRVQVAMVVWLLDRHRFQNVVVSELSRADRWTGKRTSTPVNFDRSPLEGHKITLTRRFPWSTLPK